MNLTLPVAVASLALGIASQAPVARSLSDDDDAGMTPNAVLLDRMGLIKHELKATARAVRNPDKPLDVAIVHVSMLERLIVESKDLVPGRLASLDAEQRGAELTEYRRTQCKVLIELANLEMHLLDGDREAAWGVIAGPLADLRDAGHDRFQIPEDEDDD